MPERIVIRAAQGFVISGLIALGYGYSIQVALTHGSLAVIATSIEALTRPFFSTVFQNSPLCRWAVRIFVPSGVASALLSRLVPSISTIYQATLTLPYIAMKALNYTQNDNEADAWVF